MKLDGIAAYAPASVWSNARVAARLRLERMRLRAQRRADHAEDLCAAEHQLFQTSDRWVRRFIGFSERRFCCEGEGTIDLATRAARLLLDGAGHAPADIDAIVVGTVTPSYRHSPPDTALLQNELGIPVMHGAAPRQMIGADVSLACSTWVTSLMLCYGMIRSGLARRVLLVGADRMSVTINWRDRSFATVLGDAGTATVCAAVPEAEDWFSPRQFWGWMNGAESNAITTPAGGSRHPEISAAEMARGEHRLRMDGARVRQLLVPFIGGEAMDAALEKAQWRMDELDAVVLHEANRTLNESIVRQWRDRGFHGRVLDAGGRFGNTTSASIPLALALNAPEVAIGARLALIGFGGGLSASFAFANVRHPLRSWSNVT